MMKKVLGMGAVLAGVLMAGQALAADAPYTIVKTQDLVGKQVKNGAGTVLGQVEDYVINLKDGRIVYGVLQYGDTLGFGGKLFAVPPASLSLAQDQKSVLFDATKEDLDRATGFDANKWPTEADNRWDKGSAVKDPIKKDEPKKDEPKKDEPKKDDAKKDDNAAHLRRVTSLMGTSVKNKNGEDIGSVQGIVFDLKSSKIVYAGVAYGGVAGVGSKYFAVPWTALSYESPTLKAGDRTFLINVTKAELESAPGFNAKSWPTEADKVFAKDGK